MKMKEKLDNPVWHSLNETHKNLSVEFGSINFYQPEYCPFGGFINYDKIDAGIDDYASLVDNFYVVGDRPHFTENVHLKNEMICNQMLLLEPIEVVASEQITELKTANQRSELFKLVNLIQPGYFKNKTSYLGKYYGIYKNDKLAAVAGERMKMDRYTEVSAVVTHPKHARKGYAKQLIKHTTNQIFKEDKIPYLHVSELNVGAIKLYEKLGFYTRKKISFWNLVRK